MNDLQLLRDFRAEAPHAPLPPIDFRTIDNPVARNRPWPRLLAAAAAVVVGAGAFVALQNGPGASPSEAAIVLDRAAAVLAAHPAPRPADGQWLYFSSAGITPGQAFDPDPALRAYGWETFDGSRYVEPSSDKLSDPSELRVSTVDPRLRAENGTPQRDYDEAAALPAQPQALLEAVMHSDLASPQGASEAARQYDAVADVLERRLVPSQVQANLYRALATIPGVGVDRDAEPDVLGRPVISVSFDGELDGVPTRSELLLDPHTYAYLGTRYTALEAGRVYGQFDVTAGEVYQSFATVGPIAVPHPGDMVDPLTGDIQHLRR